MTMTIAVKTTDDNTDQDSWLAFPSHRRTAAWNVHRHELEGVEQCTCATHSRFVPQVVEFVDLPDLTGMDSEAAVTYKGLPVEFVSDDEFRWAD